MSQLQAAPAIGKAPPNPIFSADQPAPADEDSNAHRPKLPLPESGCRRLLAHPRRRAPITNRNCSDILNLGNFRPLTLSTFHAEHYWRGRVRSPDPAANGLR